MKLGYLGSNSATYPVTLSFSPSGLIVLIYKMRGLSTSRWSLLSLDTPIVLVSWTKLVGIKRKTCETSGPVWHLHGKRVPGGNWWESGQEIVIADMKGRTNMLQQLELKLASCHLLKGCLSSFSPSTIYRPAAQVVSWWSLLSSLCSPCGPSVWYIYSLYKMMCLSFLGSSHCSGSLS